MSIENIPLIVGEGFTPSTACLFGNNPTADRFNYLMEKGVGGKGINPMISRSVLTMGACLYSRGGGDVSDHDLSDCCIQKKYGWPNSHIDHFRDLCSSLLILELFVRFSRVKYPFSPSRLWRNQPWRLCR